MSPSFLQDQSEIYFYYQFFIHEVASAKLLYKGQYTNVYVVM